MEQPIDYLDALFQWSNTYYKKIHKQQIKIKINNNILYIYILHIKLYWKSTFNKQKICTLCRDNNVDNMSRAMSWKSKDSIQLFNYIQTTPSTAFRVRHSLKKRSSDRLKRKSKFLHPYTRVWITSKIQLVVFYINKSNKCYIIIIINSNHRRLL